MAADCGNYLCRSHSDINPAAKDIEQHQMTDKKYPILMYGKWLGKWDAIALVDNEEHEQELLEKGYNYGQS